MYISEYTIIHFSIREVLSEIEIVQEYIVANIASKLARAFTNKKIDVKGEQTPIENKEE